MKTSYNHPSPELIAELKISLAASAQEAKRLGRALSKFPSMHPGELLLRGFMAPRGLTAEALAKAFPDKPGYFRPAELIAEFIRADPDDSILDLNLSLAVDRYFGLSDGFWWRIQAEYEIQTGIASEAAWLAGIRPTEPQVKIRPKSKSPTPDSKSKKRAKRVAG
jgi:plasmid maintenance system antidote protein VapI